MTETDHNSMLFWGPKIMGKVPTPKTAIIEIGFDVMKCMDNGIPVEFLTILKSYGYKFGYPIFMRTETLSGKHSWERTCFVPSSNDIAQHLYEIFEEQLMMDLSGVPTPKAVVIREFLYLKTFFVCKRYGSMPVAREFRFFATKGEIQCVHPYWPHLALERGDPSIPNWREYLPALEKEPPQSVFEIIKKASSEFDEQMSIDACELETGEWLITDMATGKDSFHWKHDSVDGGGKPL